VNDRFCIGVQGDVIRLHVKGSQALKAVSELVEEVYLVPGVQSIFGTSKPTKSLILAESHDKTL